MRDLIIVATLMALAGCAPKPPSDTNEIENASVEDVIGIKDVSDKYREVCVNGIVYYEHTGGGSYAVLSPKIVPNFKPSLGSYEHCN